MRRPQYRQRTKRPIRESITPNNTQRRFTLEVLNSRLDPPILFPGRSWPDDYKTALIELRFPICRYFYADLAEGRGFEGGVNEGSIEVILVGTGAPYICLWWCEDFEVGGDLGGRGLASGVDELPV